MAGGLAVSTFFTLWVVPLAYTLLEDLWTILVRLVRRVFERGPLADGPVDRILVPEAKR